MAVTQCAPGTDQPPVPEERARRESRIRGLDARETGTPRPTGRVTPLFLPVRPLDRHPSGIAPANGFGFRGRGGLPTPVGQ